MDIKSTIRTKYIVAKLIELVGLFLICILAVSFSFSNGQLDFLNGAFWIACIVALFFLLDFLYFILNELHQLRVTDEGISIKSLFTGKLKVISFKEMKKYSTSRVASHIKGVQISNGYFNLKIELLNGKMITISENKFDNYSEMKVLICKNIHS